MTLLESATILKDEAIRHAELSKAYEVALDAIVRLVEIETNIAQRQEDASTISEELKDTK